MKVNISKLSTTALAEISKRIINITSEPAYSEAAKSPLFAAVKTEYAIYEPLYTKQVFSGKGKSVAQLDKERDKLYSGLKNYIKAYIELPRLANQAQAEALYNTFKIHDLKLTEKSYAEQSALLDKLIAELDKSENQTQLEALSLKTTFEDLKAKQQEFNQVFAEQIVENADLRKTKSATSARKDLEQAIRDYLNFITLMKSQPVFSDLYAKLNEVVKATK